MPPSSSAFSSSSRSHLLLLFFVFLLTPQQLHVNAQITTPTTSPSNKDINLFASVLHYINRAASQAAPLSPRELQEQPLVVQQAVACASSSSLPTTSSTNTPTPLAAHFAKQGDDLQATRSLQAHFINAAAAAGQGPKKKNEKPFYLITGAAPVHPVVIEAVARLRGVNHKQQKHVLLRGAAPPHDDDEEEAAAAEGDHTHTHTHTNVDLLLHQAAPTPECHTASLTAAKLYTDGEIPSYSLNMSTTTVVVTNELLTPPSPEKQEEGEGGQEGEETTNINKQQQQLCTQSQGLGQVLVCIDRTPTEGTLTGTITNTGTLSLCNAGIRVLAPLPSHDGKESKAVHLSPELLLLGPSDAALLPGEMAQFNIDLLLESSTLLIEAGGGGGENGENESNNNNSISGLTVEPDFESCVDVGGRRGLSVGGEGGEGAMIINKISSSKTKQTVTISKVMTKEQLQKAGVLLGKAAAAKRKVLEKEGEGHHHLHHLKTAGAGAGAAAARPRQLTEEHAIPALMMDAEVEAHPFVKEAYWKKK